MRDDPFPASAAARVLLLAGLVTLAACAPPAALPSGGSTPAPGPSLTPAPIPTPTATPIPPVALAIRWPGQVSALQPVPIEVDVAPPPGVAVETTVVAMVFDPGWGLYQRFTLLPAGGDVYAAAEPLQLPLQPLDGDWQLAVDVQARLVGGGRLDVAGERRLVFRPSPIPFRDLSGVLPGGVSLLLPTAFEEAAAQGDRTAGGRVYRHGQGEVALWWAPGPAEPLRAAGALVMLEATQAVDGVEVVSGAEAEWAGRAAFHYTEEWFGAEGGAAEALVVQGDDHWLYVLRVRALGGGTIPPLLRQVWETFGFAEG